ncbi:MAG: DAK2 domain-containing protein [Anaerolineae bacterium]|nr:DAK2 domain-containing protein [Anaerolineae bacterium]
MTSSSVVTPERPAARGETTPVSQPTFDGQDLKVLVEAGYRWLERHREVVNALNVFPVPDGDTGINMVLTMRAAWTEIENSRETHAGRIAQAIAQGALMGARGNSGVILSQILRGMAFSLRDKAAITPRELAASLRTGSETAYKGVVKPVEGTILTVVREASDNAVRAAAVAQDFDFVFAHMVQSAGEAVEKTPSLLPVLAAAGVVDSGGKGLYYILEGMLRSLRGEEVHLPETPLLTEPKAVAVSVDPFNLPPVRYGFDIQFLLWGTDLDVEAVRQQITAMGDCPLVEGSSTLIKVHVHHFDPSVPLAYGVSQGFITDVVVENMDAMAAAGMAPDDVKDELAWGSGRAVQMEANSVHNVGVVVVAPGPGLEEVFLSLAMGPMAVVQGGQTMNPSTQDLLEAIESLATDEVILLPNNSNVILAAQQAHQLAAERMPSKRAEVVPSRTVPQGINAVLAIAVQDDLDQNVQKMTRALSDVVTGEVTIAVRDASFDGVDVKKDDAIGLLDDTLCARGDSPQEVLFALLEQMDALEAENITVYRGDQIDDATANALEQQLTAAYPDQRIEIIYGGQPHYHFIISTE